MKVYILILEFYYEDSHILGVYATREGARKALQEKKQNYRSLDGKGGTEDDIGDGDVRLSVEEYTVEEEK